MRKTIITVLAATATVMAWAGSPAIVTGTGVASGSHIIVVGETAVGQVGPNTAWHVTAGQVQGIAHTTTTTEVTDIATTGEGYSVYPNPVRDEVSVTRPDASGATLKVTALNGATMLELPLSEATSTINLSTLPAGVYILTVALEDGSTPYSVKIIKI